MAQQNLEWQTALNLWLTIPVEDWVPEPVSEPVPVDSSMAEEDDQVARNKILWEKHLEVCARIDKVKREGGTWWNDDYYIPDECLSHCECLIYEEDDGPLCDYCMCTIFCRCNELNEFSHGGPICVFCRTEEKFGF